jgi:hypothetical protein
MRARTPGSADPLLRAITDFEGTEQAILAADVALRTRQAWCAAVLACFKHACSSAPELQAVHGRWSALNARLSDEISAIVKTSIMSDKERAAWVPYNEWCAAEERLAREEFGSQRHQLHRHAPAALPPPAHVLRRMRWAWTPANCIGMRQPPCHRPRMCCGECVGPGLPHDISGCCILECRLSSKCLLEGGTWQRRFDDEAYMPRPRSR